MPGALDATLQHVSCLLPDVLDATLQHVSCHLPDVLNATLQHASCRLPDALDATLQHVSCLLPDENVFRSIMSKWNLHVKRVNGDTRRMARSALTRNGQP